MPRISYSRLSLFNLVCKTPNGAGKWNVLSLLAFRHIVSHYFAADNHGGMDAIWPKKLDDAEGESQIRFENQIKLIAYNHNPTKRVRRRGGTYIGGLTLRISRSILPHRGLYEHYCNGKTVKEGVLTLCRRDKGRNAAIYYLYAHQCVRISRMSNHSDAEGSAGGRGFGFIAIFAGIFP
ncbi:type VI secretion system tube protein Hcp [Salmonella enterica subsp. enterica]|nr:type VI secretion system tube protein Hcp [Salmonella enterica subsp. enterica]